MIIGEDGYEPGKEGHTLKALERLTGLKFTFERRCQRPQCGRQLTGHKNKYCCPTCRAWHQNWMKHGIDGYVPNYRGARTIKQDAA